MNLPNKITVFRFCCVPALMACAFIEFKYHWVATLIIYFIACMSDKADGIIARKSGIVTDFGKLMDPLSDKTLVFAAYIILFDLGWHTDIVIMIMLAREFLVAGIRHYGRGHCGKRFWKSKNVFANGNNRSCISFPCHRRGPCGYRYEYAVAQYLLHGCILDRGHYNHAQRHCLRKRRLASY